MHAPLTKILAKVSTSSNSLLEVLHDFNGKTSTDTLERDRTIIGVH